MTFTGCDYSSCMSETTEFVAEPSGGGATEHDRILVFDRAFNLHAASQGRLWWRSDEARALAGSPELIPVGRMGEHRILAVRLEHELDDALSLRSVFPEIDAAERAALGAARQRLQWVWDHHFCGRCGRETVWHEREYTLYCRHCEHRQYPRLSPCIIVAIHDGDWLLLGRSHRHPPDLWSLIAGFIEPGESAEQAVAREVAEETGIAVTNVRYQASESWPFPHQLMLGFVAEYAGGDLRRAEDELADLAWFHGASLPRVPGGWTIAGRLIRQVAGGPSDG